MGATRPRVKPNPERIPMQSTTASDGSNQDEHVDHAGERAGPHPRDLEVQGHVLGGLDLQVLPVIGDASRRADMERL